MHGLGTSLRMQNCNICNKTKSPIGITFNNAILDQLFQFSARASYTGWLKIKYPTRQYAISPQPVV